MRLPEVGDRPLNINLVPMIDVIFSILAFFILSTLFLIPSEGLDLQLPEATSSNSQAKDALQVSIDQSGQLTFQQQPVLLNDLVTSIQAQAGQTDIFVIIRADEQVNHGRVVEVMDHLRQIPRLKLAIATKSPE